jgi:FKBP-type peptidyl-prolyl cis-trans isomerase FkpA
MLRTLAALAVFGGVALALSAPARAADPKTEDEKTLYVMGSMLARQVGQFGLSESDLEFVQDGFADAVLGRKAKVEPQSYAPKIQTFAQSRQTALAQKEKDASKGVLEKAASAKGAEKLASGVIYRETKAGSGASPKASDRVKVHYHGTLRDGTVFDSSKERGEPATFPLNGVIKCWTDGVQKMKVGGAAVLTCPSDSAYGDRGAPPRIKPGAALTFEVELLEIVTAEKAPAAQPAEEKKQ